MDCDNPVMIHHDPSVHIPKIFQRYPKDIPKISQPFPSHFLNGNFRILKWRYVNVPYFGPYFLVIFPYIGLKNRPYLWDWYLQFRFLKFPLII
jgi:hypothetical protein